MVAERHVAEGDTVAPNDPLITVVDLDPLITVVDLDPLIAVVHVTEHEYGLLRPDQKATLTADAYPKQQFEGVIKRIAPVFRKTSRQARMEIEVANPDGLLKPGMFVRAEIMLERIDQATVVPIAALATRDGKSGVFVVDSEGKRVRWQLVEPGIEEGERVQLVGAPIEGRVVTIGQQLLEDGSAITIPEVQGRRSTEAK